MIITVKAWRLLAAALLNRLHLPMADVMDLEWSEACEWFRAARAL